MSIEIESHGTKRARHDSVQGLTLPSIRELGFDRLGSGHLPPFPGQPRYLPVYEALKYQPYHPQPCATRPGPDRVLDGGPVPRIYYPDTPSPSICSSTDGAQRSFTAFTSFGEMGEVNWRERSERRGSGECTDNATDIQTPVLEEARHISSHVKMRVTNRGRPLTRKRSALLASSPDRKKKDQRNAHQKESRAEEAYWIEINAGINRQLWEALGNENFTACARPVGENNRKQTGSDSLKIYRGATKVSELRMLAAVMKRILKLSKIPEMRETMKELFEVYLEMCPPMADYHDVVPGLPLPVRAQSECEPSPKRQRRES